jgi:hypothetical protein
MKTLFAVTALLFVSSAHAESWKYDCGKTMNIPRIVNISPKAPGQDGYDLKATYQTRGTDATTGTIAAKTINMIGSTELAQDAGGKETAVIALFAEGNVSMQLVIGKTSKVGSKVAGVEVYLKDNSTTEMTCTLTAHKK